MILVITLSVCSMQAGLKEDLTRLEGHLVPDWRLLAQVRPRSVQAGRGVPVFQDPVSTLAAAVAPTVAARLAIAALTRQVKAL